MVSSSAVAQNENVLVQGQNAGHVKPIIIVPPDFQGTVEVYMTPNGYQIRTHRENPSPYPAIQKSIRSSNTEKPDVSESGESNDERPPTK